MQYVKLIARYYLGLVRSLFAKTTPYERCIFHHPQYIYQIAEWRSKESIPQKKQEEHYKTIHKYMLCNWTYRPDDKRDYWQSTLDSELIMTGDCEDFATLLMKKLVQAGYDHEDVGVALTTNHAFAVIIDPETREEIALDNGYLSYYPVPISKLSVAPICGFNWTAEWSYGG